MGRCLPRNCCVPRQTVRGGMTGVLVDDSRCCHAAITGCQENGNVVAASKATGRLALGPFETEHASCR